jgi:hypothetical protein
MIFSIQRFLEDYFEKRNFSDRDQYAVSIANLYDKSRHKSTRKQFIASVHRIRTIFYKNNPTVDRAGFESTLIDLLDSRFEKKNAGEADFKFVGGLTSEKRRLARQHHKTIAQILSVFGLAIEARAIDSFWISRKKGELRSRPEGIAQSLLAVFLKGVFELRKGYVLREFQSGVGYVDVGVIRWGKMHIIEIKVITKSFTGPSQLGKYMKTESQNTGWLVVFDARPHSKKTTIPHTLALPAGKIHVLSIDINPLPPSKVRS